MLGTEGAHQVRASIDLNGRPLRSPPVHIQVAERTDGAVEDPGLAEALERARPITPAVELALGRLAERAEPELARWAALSLALRRGARIRSGRTRRGLSATDRALVGLQRRSRRDPSTRGDAILERAELRNV